MNIETAQFGAERHADCGGKLTQEIAETSRSSGEICSGGVVSKKSWS